MQANSHSRCGGHPFVIGVFYLARSVAIPGAIYFRASRLASPEGWLALSRRLKNYPHGVDGKRALMERPGRDI